LRRTRFFDSSSRSGARRYGEHVPFAGGNGLSPSSIQTGAVEPLSWSKQAIAPRLVLVDATIPDALVATLRGALPPGWDDVPDSGAARSVGDSWLQRGSSLALEVPSVHSSIETNVLINPAHPDFARLVIGNPVPFAFDRRLIGP